MRFRYRLIGTTFAERRPQIFHYKIVSNMSGDWIGYESLNLPLSADGVTIDMIICGTSFSDEERP
ncbi:MAG TPA: hypothetical protein VEU47_13850 [Candidatus Cybelea sp.]|nr:hypothetical protein [Candidatus Cybelea sp.]